LLSVTGGPARLHLALCHPIRMKTVTLFLLLVSALCVHAAESVITNLIVTPSEVDPQSVRLTAAKEIQQNVTFNYLNKTPEQVKAIYRMHPAVSVVKDGVVVARAPACTGHKDHIGPDGHVDFAGLVLIFDDLDQAKKAEKALKGEDKKPQ